MLGALFVFSGFVKSADPVGTSVFVEKYLATYSMEWLLPASLYIAVALGVVEMVLGAMLVLRLMLRRALFLTTLFLAIFTVVTLLSATLLPIGDCGCFGDAVKLTPWQTFLKNVVMLPVAVWLYRGSDKGLIVRRDAVWLSALFVVAIAINVYAIRHLPLIDFMPYKVNNKNKTAPQRIQVHVLSFATDARLFNANLSKQNSSPLRSVSCSKPNAIRLISAMQASCHTPFPRK